MEKRVKTSAKRGGEATAREAAMDALLVRIRACRVCEKHLPLGPRPVLQAGATAKLLIIGQAPGARVHRTGVPWNDPSGERLRSWLGISRDVFYDRTKVAIMAMGFCYPGKGKSGDLPPRPECAPLWHQPLLHLMPEVKLTLLIGQYALKHYLGKRRKANLAETLLAFEEYGPTYMPLPHPSPRNIAWFQRHPWFETTLVPALQARVRDLFSA